LRILPRLAVPLAVQEISRGVSFRPEGFDDVALGRAGIQQDPIEEPRTVPFLRVMFWRLFAKIPFAVVPGRQRGPPA